MRIICHLFSEVYLSFDLPLIIRQYFSSHLWSRSYQMLDFEKHSGNIANPFIFECSSELFAMIWPVPKIIRKFVQKRLLTNLLLFIWRFVRSGQWGGTPKKMNMDLIYSIERSTTISLNSLILHTTHTASWFRFFFQNKLLQNISQKLIDFTHKALQCCLFPTFLICSIVLLQ